MSTFIFSYRYTYLPNNEFVQTFGKKNHPLNFSTDITVEKGSSHLKNISLYLDIT